MEHQVNSSSNSNSRSSKSKKAKKIPQRGLGVVQLEKLRIEELKKKGTVDSSSSCPLPSFIAPLSPPKQHSLPFIPPIDAQHLSGFANDSSSSMGFLQPSTTAITPFAFDGGSNKRTSTLELTGLSNTMDQGKQIDSSSDGWRFDPLQRSQYHQRQSPIQSLHSLATPLSSGVTIQMEHPSNQIYSSNYMKPSCWPEEERMVGTDPPWLFHPDSLNAFATLARKSRLTSPFFRDHESMLMYANDPTRSEVRNIRFREDASSSGTNQIDRRNSNCHISKRLRESNTSADGGFLTLGSSLPQSMPRLKQPLAIRGGMNHDGISRSCDALQQPFYNFLLPAVLANTREPDSKVGSGGALNGVDTDLKLG